MILRVILGAVVGAVVGAGLGFAWHKVAGCSSGSCPLTGNPYVATLYGMILGVLISTSIR